MECTGPFVGLRVIGICFCASASRLMKLCQLEMEHFQGEGTRTFKPEPVPPPAWRFMGSYKWGYK